MNDESREGTDHPDPTLSQPIVAESNMTLGTSPEISRTGVTACVRVEHMSPSDRVSVRQRLEVDKENSDVDEEIFTPGFRSAGTVNVETGGSTKTSTKAEVNEDICNPVPKWSRGQSEQTRTGSPAKDRTGSPLQTRTGVSVINGEGDPNTRRPNDHVITRTGRPDVTRTGCPVDVSKIRTGCSVHARQHRCGAHVSG